MHTRNTYRAWWAKWGLWLGCGLSCASLAQGQTPPRPGPEGTAYGSTLTGQPVVPASGAAEEVQFCRVYCAWLAEPATFGLNLKVQNTRLGPRVIGAVPNSRVKQIALELASVQLGATPLDGITIVPAMVPRPGGLLPPHDLEHRARNMMQNAVPGGADRVEIRANDKGQVTLLGEAANWEDLLILCRSLRGVSECSSVVCLLNVYAAPTPPGVALEAPAPAPISPLAHATSSSPPPSAPVVISPGPSVPADAANFPSSPPALPAVGAPVVSWESKTMTPAPAALTSAPAPVPVQPTASNLPELAAKGNGPIPPVAPAAEPFAQAPPLPPKRPLPEIVARTPEPPPPTPLPETLVKKTPPVMPPAPPPLPEVVAAKPAPPPTKMPLPAPPVSPPPDISHWQAASGPDATPAPQPLLLVMHTPGSLAAAVPVDPTPAKMTEAAPTVPAKTKWSASSSPGVAVTALAAPVPVVPVAAADLKPGLPAIPEPHADALKTLQSAVPAKKPNVAKAPAAEQPHPAQSAEPHQALALVSYWESTGDTSIAATPKKTPAAPQPAPVATPKLVPVPELPLTKAAPKPPPPAPITPTKTESASASRPTLVQVKALVEKVCGKDARNVAVRYLPDGKLEVCLDIATESLVPQMIRQVGTIPELQSLVPLVKVHVVP